MAETATEYMVSESYKAAPPVAITGLTLGGVSLQDWVLVATLAYTVLMIIITTFKFFKDKNGGS